MSKRFIFKIKNIKRDTNCREIPNLHTLESFLAIKHPDIIQMELIFPKVLFWY